ncbi:MAG: DUF4296 domain-containing protein [Flavobacteriaceae bacterium]|nr:DUF4296 domain-containing protein [Flavobacteriaceae bacterium]
MKTIYFSILTTLIFIGCNSKADIDKPEDLIPPDQMEDLLFDMYVANGAMSVPNLNGEKNVNYMHLVYQKYQIDSVRFAASNLYYTSRVNDYERIFRNVKVRLDELREEYNIEADSLPMTKADSLRKIPQRIKDSIRLKKSVETKTTSF